jgi:hypothetical protein
MIEGSFKDASLPGLLQFLATEPSKLYRVKVSAGGNSGEIHVDRGSVIAAKYNLLDGEDALCEFLSWREGVFLVERLPAEFESTISKNLNLRLQGPTTFVSHTSFLAESNVGLNTVVLPSRSFGGLEWQDALRTQPLEREDFVVMAWIKDGRTMRQACREFGIDIVKATSILYRLLLTHSVEPKRAAEVNPIGALEIKQSAFNPDHLIDESDETKAMRGKTQRRSPADLLVQRLQTKDASEGVGQIIKPHQAPIQPPKTSAISHTQAVSGQFEAISIASPLTGFGVVSESEAYVPPSGKLKDEEPPVSPQTPDPNLIIDCAPEAATASLKEQRQAREARTKRTEALPLVSIDIERLFQTTFTATQFGRLATNNQTLDPHLRQTLLEVAENKRLGAVVNGAVRSPASILSTYRFCLARGYIVSPDPVVALTADLLLGRLTIDQYLLQRRRINGDELRDLIEIERQKGIPLSDLLLTHGFLTDEDFDRLLREQKRFSLK